VRKPAETRFRHRSAKSGAFRRIEVLSTDPEFRCARIAPRPEPDSLSRRSSLSRGSIAPGSRAFGSTPAAPRSGEPSTLGWLGRTLPRGFRPQDRAFARLTMPDRSARNGFYDRISPRAESIVEAVSGAAVGRKPLAPQGAGMNGGSFPARHVRPTRPAALGSSGRGADRDGEKRRDPLRQCPANHGNVRDGVREDRSRACPEEQSSRRTQCFEWVTAHSGGFRDGGKHLDPSETVALRGVAAEADLRPVTRDREESPAPRKFGIGDPGARGTFEEGRSSL